VNAQIPLIAAGTLDADVVVLFAGRRTIVNLFAEMDLEPQRATLRRGAVPVVFLGEGGPKTRDVSLEEIQVRDARRAIGPDGPRSEERQLTLLKEVNRRARKSVRKRIARVAHVEELDGIEILRVGNTRVNLAAVREALRLHDERKTS